MGATYKKYWLVNHESCPDFSSYSEDDISLLVNKITNWSLQFGQNRMDLWKTEFITRHLYVLKDGKEELVHGVRVTAVHLLTEPRS